MIIISNRWGTHVPLVDLAHVGFCFFAADLGMSFARRAYGLPQPANRAQLLTAMMTPLCAGAIVAGLLAKYGLEKTCGRTTCIVLFEIFCATFRGKRCSVPWQNLKKDSTL